VISYAAPQQKFDWSGGPKYSHNVAIGKTLEEISEKAAHEAYFYGFSVDYKTENDTLDLQAYPDYSKSKCDLAHVKAFDHGEFVINTIKEVCDRNYELETPYVPNSPTAPLFPAAKFVF